MRSQSLFHHKARRGVGVCATVLAMVLASANVALATDPQSEQQFLAMTNASRSQAGLAGLGGSAAWQGHARDHSAQMAASNSIYHDSNLAGEAATLECWDRVGENVGRGPSVGAIHDALMASPTHRANLLGDFDALGVGVEIAGDGTVYVTQRFLKSCSAPAPAPVPASAPATSPAPAPVPAPAPASAPDPEDETSFKISTAAVPADRLLEPLQQEQERRGGSLLFRLDVGV